MTHTADARITTSANSPIIRPTLPHMLTASTLYDLPFGRGKRWGSSLQGVANVLAGGWQVAAVMAYTSGRPLNVTANNTLAYFNPGRRPDIVSSDIRSDVGHVGLRPGASRLP